MDQFQFYLLNHQKYKFLRDRPDSISWVGWENDATIDIDDGRVHIIKDDSNGLCAMAKEVAVIKSFINACIFDAQR